MNDILTVLEHWQLDVKAVREWVCRAGTPRERERWLALWLLARGWSAVICRPTMCQGCSPNMCQVFSPTMYQ